MHLHFKVQGQGRPLFLLHGLLGSLENWETMARRLATMCRVYSVDLRNHGRSPHSPAMNFFRMAEDIDELCTAEGLRGIVLLGHSMGGKVAMQFAARYADRLEKLIVVDIAPKAYPSTHRSLLSALRRLDLARYASFGEIGEALAPVIADPAMRQFVLKNLTRGADGHLQWRIGLQEIEGGYDELTKAVDLSTPFCGPALFLRGERSDFIKDEDLAIIRRGFPGAECKTIRNAGHWIHTDAPEEFFTAVGEFLRD